MGESGCNDANMHKVASECDQAHKGMSRHKWVQADVLAYPPPVDARSSNKFN